ncbi:hypothetical protein DPMN_075480 [Dreissena polymorpha]|uniref:Uncharacterized protein n=1 Tax=Dreissena polymorpha TaxID=45954 RepID=A0A9D4BMP8_DREPO|nr:hypothetical protein DPMN_075480 [Dreissena polymorpha]
MTLTSWLAPAVHLKTSPTDSVNEQEHVDGRLYGEVEDHDEKHGQHPCRHQHERQEARRSDKYLGANLSKDDTSPA